MNPEKDSSKLLKGSDVAVATWRCRGELTRKLGRSVEQK